MIRILVPALLFAIPAFAQTQPPVVSEAQMFNNGMAQTMQFLSAVKGTSDQKDAKLTLYEKAFSKIADVKPGETGQSLKWDGENWQWVSPPKPPEVKPAETPAK